MAISDAFQILEIANFPEPALFKSVVSIGGNQKICLHTSTYYLLSVLFCSMLMGRRRSEIANRVKIE